MNAQNIILTAKKTAACLMLLLLAIGYAWPVAAETDTLPPEQQPALEQDVLVTDEDQGDTLPAVTEEETDGSPDLSLSPPGTDEETASGDTALPDPSTDLVTLLSEEQDNDPPADTEEEVISSSTVTSEIDLDNDNDAVVDNTANASSTTGDNTIVSEENIEDSSITTGDINVYANVLNVVNTNLYNSEITELVQNFDSLSADLFLSNPGATSQELAQDLVTKICTETECKSLTSFTLTNENLAAVSNDVDVSGDSGDNSMVSGNDVKDSTIQTGDVNAVVNVLNIVNTNLVNSRWTFASINIFGDWEGNLVLPSELYFTDYMTIGTPQDAEATLEQVEKVVLDAQNANQAVIVNDVSTDADTGSNSLAALESEDGTDGDIHDSEIQTGTSTSASNIQNVANTNIVNTRWYLSLINTLGTWAGNVYNLPGQILMSPTAGGLSFFSTTDNYSDGAYQAFVDAIASMDDSTTTESSTTETETDIDNSNNAAIVNDVDVSAQTGDNRISASDIKRSKILTGNAKALANIINFANTNLIYSDLQVGLVNVFGDWTGDIVFGFPDLSVTQQLLSPAFPKEKDRTVKFEIGYSNSGQSSMSGTTLEWQYDPQELMFLSTQPSLAATQPQPGLVRFDLGKIAPNGSEKLEFKAKTLSDLEEGTKVVSYARVWGLGPELSKTNNESILESIATTTEATSEDQGGQDNGGNNGGGGSGGGGGSYQQTNLVRIYKHSSAEGQTVKAGDTISFSITIDNDGTNDVYNAMVYDTLRGPDNNVISTREFSLDTLAARERAAITYDLGITSAAPNGTYTMSAYVEALNSSLQQVRSQNTAVSSFTIGNSAGGAGGQTTNGTSTQESFDVTGGETGSSTAITLNQENNAGNQDPLPIVGQVKGARTQRSADQAENIPEPLAAVAGSAQASIGDQPIVPQFGPSQGAQGAKDYSLMDQIIGILLICFLIALGYATANMIKRSKDAALANGPKMIPQDEPPVFTIKKITPRKASTRLKKNPDSYNQTNDNA